jgi:hypothetical protein
MGKFKTPLQFLQYFVKVSWLQIPTSTDNYYIIKVKEEIQLILLRVQQISSGQMCSQEK